MIRIHYLLATIITVYKVETRCWCLTFSTSLHVSICTIMLCVFYCRSTLLWVASHSLVWSSAPTTGPTRECVPSSSVSPSALNSAQSTSAVSYPCQIIGENLHCYTGYTLISFVSLQVLQFSDLWRTFNVNFIFFTSFLTDIPFSFNYGMIMQPLQSELVMRSIKMLAEKYSQDRNRVELLQPYIGTTSCLSKVGNNDLIGSCDKERPSHMRNKLGIAKCIVK